MNKDKTIYIYPPRSLTEPSKQSRRFRENTVKHCLFNWNALINKWSLF